MKTQQHGSGVISLAGDRVALWMVRYQHQSTYHPVEFPKEVLGDQFYGFSSHVTSQMWSMSMKLMVRILKEAVEEMVAMDQNKEEMLKKLITKLTVGNL